MGMVASLLRRYYAARSRDCEEEEEKRVRPAATRTSSDWRRPGMGLAFLQSQRFQAAAFSHVMNENWREAALAFTEQAANDLKFGHEGELKAASALLRSAKCYGQVEDKDEGEVAATKHALEKAIALFVKKNDLEMAATSCEELAEFYLEHQKLQSAFDSYKQAADCFGANRARNRYCRFKANLIRYMLDNEEVLRVKGFLPLQDYKRRFARYIKSSDPDWGDRVTELFRSTSIIQPRLL